MGKIQDIGDRLFNTFQEDVVQGSVKGRIMLTPQESKLLANKGMKRFHEAAQAERERHHLGMIARARIAFYLQKRLLRAGYPPSLVRQVLFSLLLAAFAS